MCIISITDLQFGENIKVKHRHTFMKKILILLILFCVVACGEIGVVDRTIYVYRTKNDYSRNVCVELSADKSRVTGFSAPSTRTKEPLKLANGYLLYGSCGVNSGFVSLLMEDYTKPIGADSLYKLLIDKDPFIDFYECANNSLYTDTGVDTVKINQIIKKNELNKYFRKLK
jgi:hypothetical protein